MSLKLINRISFGLVVVTGALVVFALAHGCSGRPSDRKQGQKGDKTAVDQCDIILNNVFTAVQPERLGITSESETAVDNLNEWAAKCVKDAKIETSADAQRVLSNLLANELLERVIATRFVSRDALHLRDALWYKKTIEFATGSADNDLDRIVHLFYYVVRNVALVDVQDDSVPLSPFDICMMGKGTAEDRAWLFAELLRQLYLDAVILRPKFSRDAGESHRNKQWLIGVLLDDAVYLFDPRIGLPIPIDSEKPTTPLPERPATLQQVVSDDEFLRRLDTDKNRPYPLRAADLQNCHVELIGNSSYWAPRMWQLQLSLSGERSIVIFDSLADNQLHKKGLLTRVAETGAGYWSRDDISVWPYPEVQLEGFQNLDDGQKQRLAEQQSAFTAPIALEIDPDTLLPPAIDPKTGQPKFDYPRKRHQKARISQLCGDFKSAIISYISIRLWKGLPPMRIPKDVITESRKEQARGRPDQTVDLAASDEFLPLPEGMRPFLSRMLPADIRKIHRKAAEDALFWSGACQIEQGNAKAASRTMYNYYWERYRYPNGAWTTQARYLRAISLAKTGQYDVPTDDVEKHGAVQVLKEAQSDDPRFDEFQILIRRWKALHEGLASEDATPS